MNQENPKTIHDKFAVIPNMKLSLKNLRWRVDHGENGKNTD